MTESEWYGSKTGHLSEHWAGEILPENARFSGRDKGHQSAGYLGGECGSLEPLITESFEPMRMAFSGQRFSGCFAHPVRVMAALKRPVIEDELVQAEFFPGQCFAFIQRRFKPTVKVLDHRATTMGEGSRKLSPAPGPRRTGHTTHAVPRLKQLI